MTKLHVNKREKYFCYFLIVSGVANDKQKVLIEILKYTFAHADIKKLKVDLVD